MSSSPGGIFERLVSLDTLHTAWQRVRLRAGAPGVDRVSVRAYGEGVGERLTALAERLRGGSWRPSAVRRVFLPGERARPLSIPTVEDRIVQRALADLLMPLFEPTLSPAAWAYRPGRSVGGALAAIEGFLAAGHRYFLRTDIEKFFDRIDQDRLLAMVAAAVDEPRTLDLLRRIVRAQVLEGAVEHVMVEGVPQGSGLSPLLSNVYLRGLDAAMTGAGYPYVRYADDMLVLGSVEEETAEALDLLATQVEALGLRLGAPKTQRGHVGEGFTFLGARFGPEGRGPSRGALDALHARAAELIAADESEPARLAALSDLLRRWREHHGGLRSVDIGSVALLLGFVLTEESPDRKRQKSLAAWRKRLDDTGPAWLHVVLAEHWAAWELPALVLIETRAASLAEKLARPEAQALRERLTRTLALREEHAPGVLAALAHPEAEGLAARLGAAGLPRLADLVRGGLFARRTPPLIVPGLGAGELDERWLRELPGFFLGRAGQRGVLQPDSRGHLRFHVEPRALDEECWRAHLEGRRCHALLPLREDESLGLSWLRLAVPRKEAACQPPDRLAGLVLDSAARCLRAAEALGGRGWHEALAPRGGRHEHRLWFLFEGRVTVRDARALLLRVVSEAGALPPPVICQPFPETDSVRSGEGACLPLPLFGGSKGEAAFVGPSGAPLPDPLGALGRGACWSAEAIRDLVRRGPLAADRSEARGRGVGPAVRDLQRIARVFEGCAVLRAVADKALDLGHLEGMESQCLFESLGHIAGQGREALLRLVAATSPEAERLVERRLQKLGPHPVSCARIRQRLPKLAEKLPCACRFARLGSRGYPSPVFHTLRVEDIPVLRPSQRKTKSPPAPPPFEAPAVGDGDPVAALVRRWLDLRRRRAALHDDLVRVERELRAVLDGAEGARGADSGLPLFRFRDREGRRRLGLDLGPYADDDEKKEEEER